MNSTLKIKNSLLFIAVGALTFFSCNFSDHNIPPAKSNASKLNSGVTGQALRGPSHSGPVQAGDNLYVGFAAAFNVYSDRGEFVTSFNSDSEGWFRVELAPGQYSIEFVPGSSSELMSEDQATQQVSVTKGLYSNVVLHFDTAGLGS